jgi:hypothetical protein
MSVEAVVEVGTEEEAERQVELDGRTRLPPARPAGPKDDGVNEGRRRRLACRADHEA